MEKLGGDAARRIARLVRHSELRAELDPAGLPRSLRAVIDFGQRPPDELRDVLGPYATPRLEITLAVAPASSTR